MGAEKICANSLGLHGPRSRLGRQAGGGALRVLGIGSPEA